MFRRLLLGEGGREARVRVDAPRRAREGLRVLGDEAVAVPAQGRGVVLNGLVGEYYALRGRRGLTVA